VLLQFQFQLQLTETTLDADGTLLTTRHHPYRHYNNSYQQQSRAINKSATMDELRGGSRSGQWLDTISSNYFGIGLAFSLKYISFDRSFYFVSRPYFVWGSCIPFLFPFLFPHDM